MKKLKILMLASGRRFKSDVRAYAMARHLVECGHHVTLIVTADHRRWGLLEYDWDGVWGVESPDLLWGRLRSGWDPWSMLNRILYIHSNENSYDLIHALDTRPASIYPALYAREFCGAPVVTDWIDWWGRGGIINENRPTWYRILFGWIETYYEEAFRTKAEGVTVISTALAKRSIGLGVKPERICYLPNGSQPDLFNVPNSLTCREKVGLDVKGPIIGYSSLDTHLDLSIMIQVLARIISKHPDIQLLITGSAPQGITELAHSYNVQNNLILTGFLPYEQLPWYLGCADIFVMPFPEKISNIGRWPSKINNYMSVGRPVISNPVGDVKDLFEKHKIGLLTDFDPEGFAQKIIFLLEHPSICKQLGENGRRTAVLEYDWKILIRRLENFYWKIFDMS